MTLMILCVVILAICCDGRTGVLAQGTTTVKDNAATVSSGLAEFSLELLAKTAKEAGDQTNIILSTYSIWTLMAILNVGARGSTSNQLVAALRIPSDDNVFRFGFKTIGDAITTETPGVEIDVANTVFTNRNKQLIREFQNQAASQYKVNFMPVNFNQPQTAEYIDAYIANVTRNRIRNFINFDDLADAQMLLTTAIFFKGQWNLPFNKSATFRDTFYDETMTRSLGQVMMMYQIGPYTYTSLSNLNLKAHAVELPYGPESKYSMIVILPMKNIPLSTILNQLLSTPLQNVFDNFERAREEYFEEDVIVYLPRFQISSDYVMNVVLEQMGIWDVFDPNFADLQKISSSNFYLSRVIHKAKIEVTEEGTVATAASGGTIAYKSPPPVFNATRPFAYLIVEKTTNTVLFAGKFSNPNI